jgi:cytoskeletal protein CcmA (bactofilin family)
MTTSSSTRIDGKLNGKITGENSIVVGETGVIIGEVRAPETVVYGRVEGVIESGSLQIKRSGIVLGDIFIESLVVEDGGIYNGRCTMNETTENISIETTEGTKKELSSNAFEIKEVK